MNTKTKGTKKLSTSFLCDVCGKKANVRHYKIGTKCFKHLPKVGA
jgi:ribosomal protein L44E